jgi:hypothetical protein
VVVGGRARWRTTVRVGRATGQIGVHGLDVGGLHIERHADSAADAADADARVRVVDRFTNPTGRDIGVVVEHALALPAPAPEVRLGGPDTPGAVRAWAPWNPSLFAPLGPVSVGLVVDDDAQRAQCVYRYDGASGTATARTERLVVGAGRTVELTTSLYALAAADYFDFANRIRRDWGVAVTLDGPYWWGWVPETVLHRSVEDLAEIVARTGITAAVTGGGWVDTLKGEPDPRTIGFGVGVNHPWFADYRRRLAQSVELLRQAAPGIRIALYDHMFLNSPEDDPEHFHDSWMMKSASERQVTSFAPEYKSGAGVVPTTENSFGRAFAEEIDRQVDDLGFDGIYFDETNFPSGVLERSFSVGDWDGVSGTVDPDTGEVVERIGYTWLLARDYQKGLFESLRAKGVWVLGNGQPHTTDANAENWPRFTETHATLLRAYEAHLYAPMAYSFGSWTMAEIRDRLRVGLVPCTTGPEDGICVVRHFFPITPTELHAGWMKGPERVIATEDGAYGWDGRFNYRLRRFDAEGAPLPPEEGAAESEVNVSVPEGGVAVLERLV